MANAYRLVRPVDHSYNNFWHRLLKTFTVPENRAVVASSFLFFSLAALGALFLVRYQVLQAQNVAIEARAKLLLAQALLSDNRKRTAAQAAYDTEKALKLVKTVSESHDAEAARLLPLTLSRIDDSARGLLGAPALIDNLVLSSSDKEKMMPAQCVTLEPSYSQSADKSLRVPADSGYKGLAWVRQKSGEYRWRPVFNVENASAVEFERSALAGTDQPAGLDLNNRAIYCLSSNGFLLLIWEEGQVPRMADLKWFPVKAGLDQVIVHSLDSPLPSSEESFNWLIESFGSLYGEIDKGSNSGISEITTDEGTLFVLSRREKSGLDSKFGIQIMSGVVSPRRSRIPSQHIQHMRCPEKRGTTCVVSGVYRGQEVLIKIYPVCNDIDVCTHAVRLATSGTEVPWLVLDGVTSAQIREAGIIDDQELWMVDAMGQAWLYEIGITGATKWAKNIGHRADNYANLQHSVACQQLKCEDW
jgi:hypothetical protein